MRRTKEFYELREQFEKDITTVIYGCEIKRADPAKNPSHVFYDNGTINTAFKVYMLGYSNGKSL